MTRLIVTQVVVGHVPRRRKHWLLAALRRAIDDGSPPGTYTIALAEVIGVKDLQ